MRKLICLAVLAVGMLMFLFPGDAGAYWAVRGGYGYRGGYYGGYRGYYGGAAVVRPYGGVYAAPVYPVAPVPYYYTPSYYNNYYYGW